MEKCVFYLETSNDKELENSFLAYLEKETTEEDRLFAMSERGQELRKILGLSQKANKIIDKSLKYTSNLVVNDNFVVNEWSGGVTPNKFQEIIASNLLLSHTQSKKTRKKNTKFSFKTINKSFI
jgi:hypothetical protein